MRRRTPPESELPLTFREFLSILWRRNLTIGVCIVVAVVAAFAYADLKKPTYQSSSTVLLNTTNQTTGQATSPVTFPDPVQLLSSTATADGAAKILHDPDTGAVTAEVTGTVDPNTGALTITASDSDPARAEAVAKAYTTSFLNQVQDIVNAQLTKIGLQMASIQSQINTLSSQGNGANNPTVAALSTTLANLQTQESTIKLGEPYASVQVAPSLPGAPIGLGKAKILGIGLLAGLLLGVGAALVREQFDTRLRASPDLAEISQAPVLAELPQDGDVRTGKVSIALVQAPQSRLAESVRELRTSLRVVLDDTPAPALMVTSPEAGDGKTFVAANLAAAWALSGSKVIVVSADFRRPRLEEVFGLQPTGLPGLADVIKANWKKPEGEGRPPPAPSGTRTVASDAAARAGDGDRRHHEGTSAPSPGRRASDPGHRPDSAPTDESSVGHYLVDTGIWGLHLLPAGTHLDNPSELFGSPGMQPVMDQLPLLADIVIFDSPPVLAAPDAAILGGLVHGAVVVAAESKTDRHDLERTVHRLESTHCRVLGVTVNRTRRSSGDSYRYYAYTHQ